MRYVAWPSAGIVGALVAVLLVAGAAIDAPAFAQEAPARDVTVSVSRSEVSVLTGETFTFTSEVTNSGSEATPPLIVNLAFVAIDQSTYVDPEDWSPERTLSVAPVPADSSATQTWTVKPVLPQPPALAGAGPLAASPAILLHVEEHRTLNPGGVLPVVLAVPGVLALAFAGLRVARRR